MTKYEEDIEWLLERTPQATESQKDRFVEKVAVCCANNMNENIARQQVLEILNHHD